MAANILLFKTRDGRYVKLNIVEFYDDDSIGNGAVGAAFDVTKAAT